MLLKPGRLEPDEFDRIKTHCNVGRAILRPLTISQFRAYQEHVDIGVKLLTGATAFPLLQLAATIAQTHHEKWDGTGYPLGLAGNDIPIEGRITAVADVYDALSSKRPYKPAFAQEKCLQILEEQRAKHFDPLVLDAFFSRRDEIIATQLELADSQ